MNELQEGDAAEFAEEFAEIQQCMTLGAFSTCHIVLCKFYEE
jgi:hypothetical protein